MYPVEFKEQTKVLRRPVGMTDRQCANLPVYSDGEYCISCWKMGFIERLKTMIFGKVWVWVHSGETQPPITLKCYKTAFKKEKEGEGE